MTEFGFTEKFVEADGFHIRYVEKGDGPPLVALHGAGGLRLSPTHNLLAAKHRVIAFEMPGFGESAINERSRTAADLAASMNLAVQALGVEQRHVWGTSFGSRIAAEMTLQAPERVETLTLMSPAIIRTRAPAHRGEPSMAMLHAYPERQPPREPISDALSAKQRAVVVRLLGPLRDPELEARLAQLETPTLVLFGTKDTMTPPENGRIYRALMPQCQFVLIYDAAHALDADRPEAVADLMLDHMERRGGFIVRRTSGLVHP